MHRCICWRLLAVLVLWPSVMTAQVEDGGLRLLPPLDTELTGQLPAGMDDIESKHLADENKELVDGMEAVEEHTFLEEQPASGWFYPRMWKRSDCWEGGIELGANGSQGNSETISVTAGANAERVAGPATITWDVIYVRTQSESIETQNNLLTNVDYDFSFADSAFSWFSKTYFEYDEFKAFDSRLAVNTGGGVDFIDSESGKITGRFGAGWSREFNGPDDRIVPEATFGVNAEHQLTDRQELVLDVQYLPEWEQFSHYRFVADAHWQILLREGSNLHLKIGLIDRYDSTPNGAKANDLTYSLLLLWKI